MARFRGTVQGARGEASRLGHAGLRVSCDGWNQGVAVEAGRYTPDKDTDADVHHVTLDGGSNGSRERVYAVRVLNGRIEVQAALLAACANLGEALAEADRREPGFLGRVFLAAKEHQTTQTDG